MFLQISIRLCLVGCKIFSGKENIFGKGKYFQVFGCIPKNVLENIFWYLVVFLKIIEKTHFLLDVHIFSTSKQNPTKKKSSMARSEWKKTHSSEWWVWWMGSLEWWVRRRGAIGVVRVGSSAIWCEWVREWWRDDLTSGATISLLSLLSLSVSLFARGPKMARRSRWSVTGFDKDGFERSERCDRLALMRSSCILAPTRRSSCFFSLSLFYFPRPKIVWSENENGNHFPPFWLYFTVNPEMFFSSTQFKVTTKHPLFRKIISKISLKPKQTEP